MIEEEIEKQMAVFESSDSDYCFDTTTPGRIIYFYHDPQRYWKYIRPVIRRK